MTSPASSSGLLDDVRRTLAGRYTVSRCLGAGGMGSVFLGRDVTLDRPVAIKVIAPEFAASSAFRERFLHEARTVARLRHPNIVAVYAAGEADGMLYFVMEYVEGESLRDRLDRDGRFDGPAAAGALRELAGALHYAHEHGVVHRDVKPENVMLDAATGCALLTDFGIAHALEAGDGRLTGTGILLGSPRYMSPEQVAGDGALDGRSDVYSLGLVGYEMFTGEPAIGEGSGARLLVRQLTETPPPLATRNPRAPAAVAAAVDRALEKDPDRRWPTAAAMADALAGTADGADLRTSPGGSAPPASAATTAPDVRGPASGTAPWWRRRRGVAAAGALAAAVLTAGWYAARDGGVPRGVDPRHSFLVAPFEVLTGDPQLGWLREGSVSMLSMSLAQWSDLSVVDYEHSLDLLREARLDGTRAVGLDGARRMARRAGVWTVVMGQVSSTPDSLVVIARLFDVASGRRVDQAQRAAVRGADPRPLFDALSRDLLDLAGAPPGAAPGRLVATTTWSVDAYRAYLDGTRALNAWDLERADSLFRRATRADTTFALAYYKLALTLGWSSSGDTTQLVAMRHANALAARLPERERGIVGAYGDLVTALHAQQVGDSATEDARFLTAQRRYAALVQRDPGAAEAWYGLGDAYWHHRPGGWGSPRAIANWTVALRAFDRTLALDSTFHLAYLHKLDIYQTVGSATATAVLDGDSIRPLFTDADRRAFGPARIELARRTARERAVGEARAWLATDPVPQAYQALVEAFAHAGHLDSAAAVAEEGARRLGPRGVTIPFDLAGLQLRGDPAGALRTLRAALAAYEPAGRAGPVPPSQTGVILASATAAAYAGSAADVDRIVRLFARVQPPAAHAGPPNEAMGRWWAAAAELAMGMPERATRPAIDSGIAWLDRLPGPGGPATRRQLTATPYVAYLATRDPRYLAVVRRWGAANAPTPELDALEALQRGDSAAARRAAARFPSLDSLRAAGGGMTPMRWVARAEALASLGDARGALHIYEGMEPERFSQQGMVDAGWPLYARTFAARARLHEQLGDDAAAAAAWARFLELWKDADPALQPQLAAAREGLARTRDGAAATAVPFTAARAGRG